MVIRRKYPRTPHLPWSPGRTKDDRVLDDLGGFEGQEVVVTEKLDGENTTFYRDGWHPRSPDAPYHPSRDWVARLHAQIAHEIPEGWRLVGENLYARHAIAYEAIESYFYLFAIFADGQLLSWDETVEWAALLGLVTVPLLYRGLWDPERVRACYTGRSRCGGEQEGYVVRVAGPISEQAFGRFVAKYVRPDHVQSEVHWRRGPLVPNRLRGSAR